MDDTADFLARYYEELTYLRSSGQVFARQHPKLAERLELDREGSADPHVERLLESFALLTSRLQRRFDGEFPEFTSALLTLLYPNLSNPVPPMTIAQIMPDGARAAQLLEGYRIPAHTQMFAQTSDGLTCRFRSEYPVDLWPLKVTNAGFAAKTAFDFLDNDTQTLSVLRLRVAPMDAKVALPDIKVKQLRFHLNGPQHVTAQLYELLFENCRGVVLYCPATEKHVSLPVSALTRAGFGEHEGVIPDAPESHPAYRLLQEYFWLPEKFLFFDLAGLERNPSRKEIEILFLLDAPPRPRLLVTAETFALGCTPVVNLFPRTSEPIRLDETRTEYRVIPDARRERTTEVHSILSVSSSSNPAEKARELRPLYGAVGTTTSQDAFWHSRRIATERLDSSGTDVHLSFVDLAFNPSQPPSLVVFAHLLCTNRELAMQVSEGTLLQTEEPAPIQIIRCLRKPTAPGYPPLGGASRWALISSLRLNYLSLTEGKASLSALRRILELYSFSNSSSVTQQMEGLTDVSVRKVMRRMSHDIHDAGLPREAVWQSFRRGYEVKLQLNRNAYPGGSPLLFTSVLREFLQLYAPINSFVELKTSTFA